ncbi:hypothetical protein [Paenibacillus favisporus]|uniref:hypothetical protein n=1 Tax=Paenibacillus favisporus TaxID=221028 RepID=UPI0013D666F2|nr:hypothetical protein [Paenibacillus favisporus]
MGSLGAHVSGGIAPKSMPSLRNLFVSPLRVRLMLPTAVAREFLGMDDEEEIRSQLMLPMLAFLWKAFRRTLTLLQHESGRSAGFGEGGAMPAALRQLITAGRASAPKPVKAEPTGAQLL